MFTEDFKTDPYWWDTASLQPVHNDTLPEKAEVVVIGAGYTGLHAALQIARGGREVLVLDGEQAGWGCSTRNGGQISTSLKPGYGELNKKYGHEKAIALLQEGKRSLQWIEEFVNEENLDCDFQVVGRFHAAHNTTQFKKLSEQIKEQIPGLENGAFVVPQSEQRQELGTDTYYGGVVFPQHASVNPAKYHRGILEKVLAAGATVKGGCKVENIINQNGGYQLTTPQGQVSCDQLVIATNGYTGKITPWQRRRVIPIGSYVIATEEIDEAIMNQLMPKNRIVSDSRKVVFYYRPSPDRKRIVFGGRVSHNETNPLVSGPKLHHDLVKIFPELQNTRISHSWVGFVAYTFDTMMHVGRRDNMYYAMGYCGSGVGMASYLGMRLGLQVLQNPEGKTAFDELPFPTRPLYNGNPWFLGASVAWYRFRDSLNI